MDTENLIVLRTFSNDIDARLACVHLKAEGIESYVKSNTLQGLWPNPQNFQDVRLVVLSDVKDRADEILKAMGI